MKIKEVFCLNEIMPLNVIKDLYLSWTLIGTKKQDLIEVKVYDSNENLIFNQKEVTSKQYFYFSLDLKPLEKYRYTLQVFEGNESDIITGYFISGLVNGFNKKAKWIGDGKHFDVNQKEVGSKAIYIRKIINVDEVITPALLNICGLGLFTLFINGKKVSDRVLEPGFAQYDKEILYCSYLVNNYLKPGDNEIEVVLGEGWYSQSCIDEWWFYKAPWRGDLKLLFELDLNGKTIVSDESWNYSYGEIISDCLRVGEVHDFNFVKEYKNVVIMDAPEGKLIPSQITPIKEVEEISPKLVNETQEDYIYDFGKNMAGYCKVLLSGPKGSVIKVSYSDRLENGKVDNKSNSQYIYNESFDYQTDKLICSGKDDFYVPRFVYHTFRYVTVSKPCNIKDIKAYFVHTDFSRTGYFECSDEIINKLYDMSIQAIRSNFHSYPTDCPHREKNGWTGDAQLSLIPSIYNFNMQESYRKWLRDIVASQKENGQIPCLVPTSGWGYDWGSGPAWDVAFFTITEALYDYYDDIQIVKEVYPSLAKYFNHMTSRLVDNLLLVGLGDWNFPKNIKFDVCPTELTCSCYYLQMAKILKKFSNFLEIDDNGLYDRKIKETKDAIIKKYKNEKSLTGLAALTFFDIEDHVDDICSYLKEHDYAPHFGILGNKYIFSILGKYGKIDEGVNILLRKDYPSFRYWIDHGQTTLCEDFELTNSLNHHMFSPIIEFMSRYILGIEIEYDGGVTLNPKLGSKISFAKGSVASNCGNYNVSLNGNKLSFSVPANGKVVYNKKEYFEGNYEVIINA